MRFVVLVVVAVAPLLAEDTAPGPLQSLTKIAVQLDKGIVEWLGGAEAKDAFSPWKGEAKDEAKLRESLTEAGITQAACMGFELHLVFTKADEPVYYLRTFVCANAANAALGSVKGKATQADNDGLVRTSRPCDAYVDQLAPFGEAADKLLEMLKGDGWKDVPYVNVDELMKEITSEKARKDASQEVEKGKAVLEQVHVDLEKLDYDSLRVRLDRITFFGYGADGKGLGVILCCFHPGDRGKVLLEIGMVKLFEK